MSKEQDEYIWAVKNGDMDTVKEITENTGGNIVNSKYEGRYPIHFAADYGQSEVLEYILQKIVKKDDIDQKDDNGYTALSTAEFEGHTDCVNILLDKGASKNMEGQGDLSETNSEIQQLQK